MNLSTPSPTLIIAYLLLQIRQCPGTVYKAYKIYFLFDYNFIFHLNYIRQG